MIASVRVAKIALAAGLAGGGIVAVSWGQDEKAKALASPYANDLGPESLNVAAYPKDIQKGYALLAPKCAKCHTAARPLNSQFIEPPGDSPGAQEAAVTALKAKSPELFKERSVWQIEPGIWKRYVKRMMAKPGCDIPGPEGKQIYAFLAYDSHQRKLKDPKGWTAARKKLLADFKKKNPERYKELYGD